MKIRLHGTEAEVTALAARMGEVCDVLDQSRVYEDRAPSALIRVYLTVKVREKEGESDG